MRRLALVAASEEFLLGTLGRQTMSNGLYPSLFGAATRARGGFIVKAAL